MKPISKQELLLRVHTHLELLDINRNLEQKVRDRTAAIEETETRKLAQKKLGNHSSPKPVDRSGKNGLARHLDHGNRS